MIPEGTFQFLGFFDGLAILIWLFILLSSISSTYIKNKQNSIFRYYRVGFYTKLFAAISFSIVYIIKYSGGDTAAYWDTAQKFNNLFFTDISKFAHEFFNPEPFANRYLSFDINTGVPPEWIYNEKEGLFTAKIYTLLTFITFRSYFAMTMICAFISFKASWKILELAQKYKVASDRNIAIGSLFLPSTAFWCTGISKDTIVYCCVIFAIDLLFKYFEKDYKKNFIFYFKLFIIYFLLSNIRDFMLIVALGPFIFSLGIKWSNKEENSGFAKFGIQAMLILIILFGLSLFFSSSKAVEITKEAQVIQSDLRNNSEYGGAKYDLGITDYSPIGMLKAMPISIFTAFFRPFIWESGSLFILISAVETFVFLILTISLVFRTGIVLMIKQIRLNEFLIMAIVFSLILGFFAGYTSGLFGVLVRFKAPFLPFLFIVLTMNIKSKPTLNQSI
jgi:hypothetical protein